MRDVWKCGDELSPVGQLGLLDSVISIGLQIMGIRIPCVRIKREVPAHRNWGSNLFSFRHFRHFNHLVNVVGGYSLLAFADSQQNVLSIRMIPADKWWLFWNENFLIKRGAWKLLSRWRSITFKTSNLDKSYRARQINPRKLASAPGDVRGEASQPRTCVFHFSFIKSLTKIQWSYLHLSCRKPMKSACNQKKKKKKKTGEKIRTTTHQAVHISIVPQKSI